MNARNWVNDQEKLLGWVHPQLDYDYIAQCAEDIAADLSDGCAEVAYQPGDGTFYGLVFVPLMQLVPARPRVKDGVAWEARAIRGMFGYSGQMAYFENVVVPAYDRYGFLIAWVEHAAYPLALGPGTSEGIAATYVAEHWNTTPVSATSLAILFRGIAAELEKFYDEEGKRI
jgi:hypothetical protein